MEEVLKQRIYSTVKWTVDEYVESAAKVPAECDAELQRHSSSQ